MVGHRDLLGDFPSQDPALLTVLSHQGEVVTSQDPDMTESPSSVAQGPSVHTERFSAVADHSMASQMGIATLQSVTQTANPLLSSVDLVLQPRPTQPSC